MTAAKENGETVHVATGQVELQLFTAMATLQAEFRGSKETGEKTYQLVVGIDERQRKAEQDIVGLTGRVETLEAKPAPSVPVEYSDRLTRVEDQSSTNKELIGVIQSALEASKLTWPKLITGVGAVVATLIALDLLEIRPN